MQIIDEASYLGIRSVSLSGGEPFLRSDIMKIIEYMLKNNIYPLISTKANLSGQIARHLSEFGLRDIQVSLDSSDQDVANFLSGSSNYYEECLESIKNLVNYGIKVNVNCVVTSFNVKQIPSLLDLVDHLGVSCIALTPYVKSLGRHKDRFVLNQEENEWLCSFLCSIEGKYSRLKISESLNSDTEKNITSPSVKNDASIICSAGLYGFVLLPNGDVTICERLAKNDRRFIIGNLKNQSIMDIWNHPAWDEFCSPDKELYKGTKCFDCNKFCFCTEHKQRCFVDTIVENDRIYGPSSKSCFIVNQLTS